MSILNEILSSKARAEVFRLLFDGTDKNLHLREIERLSSLSVTAISKELKNLVGLDLVIQTKDGNRINFKANTQHPIYSEIKNLVTKSCGFVSLLQERLSDPRVKLAFIFGSIARRDEKATSDIDLFVVGDLGLREVSKLLCGAQEEIQREINPHVYKPETLSTKIMAKDHFITQLMKDSKMYIIGDDNVLKGIIR